MLPENRKYLGGNDMTTNCTHCNGLLVERYDHELRETTRQCVNCSRPEHYAPRFEDGRALMTGLLCIDCQKNPRFVIKDTDGRIHRDMELARCWECRIKVVKRHRALQTAQRKSKNPNYKIGNVRMREILS